MSLTRRFIAGALTFAFVAAGSAVSATPASTPVARGATGPATTDWLAVIVATPQGGFREGNPNARVKLLEFGALTCPHCAGFAKGSVPILRAKYIATGRVSYEYRPFLLSGVDFAPALLVECQAPAAAVRLIEAFYDTQATWTLPFTKPLPDDVQKRLTALPEAQQITALAVHGGLDTFMRTRGMTRAKFDACTSDKASIAKLEAIRDDADTNYGLTAVPTFAINGKTVPGVFGWAELKPALDTALAAR